MSEHIRKILLYFLLMTGFIEGASAEILEGFAANRSGEKIISINIELAAGNGDRIFGKIANLKHKSYIYVFVDAECNDGNITKFSRKNAKLLPNLMDNGDIHEQLSAGGRIILEEAKKNDGPTALVVVVADVNGRPPRKIKDLIIACGPLVTAID